LPVCRWLVFPNSNGNVDKLGRADVVDKRVLVDFHGRHHLFSTV
jgi:hypothetical protein